MAGVFGSEPSRATTPCAGDWVVSFEEHPFDRLTTENPVELTLDWAGDEAVDFGITRSFHIVGTCWWLGHPAAVGAALPFDVAGTSYETYDQVRAVLRGSPSCWSAQLHQLIVLAKLNDSRFGIGVHPWMDFDGDGVCETIGDLIAMAEAALETGDYTSFRNWCIALHAIL